MTAIRAAGVALLAAIGLAACAGVPDSGPVRVGDPVAVAGSGLVDAAVREIPAGPQPGASPVLLVSGFLRAMVGSDDNYGVARSYLAAGTGWSPERSISIYAEPSHVVRVGRRTVVVTAHRLGVLGQRGAYRVAPGSVHRRFELARRNHEWRIVKLAAGILLSSDDASRLLQPANLYFLTPAGDRLVPQPVLESPQDPGLATTLMRGLVAGPGPYLAPGVRTAVPRGTALVGNVPVTDDGVAEVDLSAGASQISSGQLLRMSAQIVWTLRQLTSVSAVRLLVNGAPLEAPGVPTLQPIESWPQFDPAVPAATTRHLLVRAGKVAVAVNGAAPRPVTMTGRLDGAEARDVALSRDATRAAVVVSRPAGDELDVATVVGSGSKLALREGHLVVPATSRVSGVAWAAADEIVTTVSGAGGRRFVVAVGPDGYAVHELPDGGLPSDVNAIAAAPGQHLIASSPTGEWQLVGRRWHRVSQPAQGGG